jgi:hypothetical protein
VSLIAKAAFVGARGIDTAAKILTPADCHALRSDGIDFAIRYLPSLRSAEAADITDAGLALMAVCYADGFDGAATVAAAKAAALPPGVTIWADLESDHDSAAAVTAAVNAWAIQVKNAGYDAGLYVGCDQPLDADGLFHLAVDRYWRSASWVPEPSQRGYCMYQLRGASNVMRAGVLVDVDVIEQDKRGAVPTWCVAA